MIAQKVKIQNQKSQELQALKIQKALLSAQRNLKKESVFGSEDSVDFNKKTDIQKFQQTVQKSTTCYDIQPQFLIQHLKKINNLKSFIQHIEIFHDSQIFFKEISFVHLEQGDCLAMKYDKSEYFYFNLSGQVISFFKNTQNEQEQEQNSNETKNNNLTPDEPETQKIENIKETQQDQKIKDLKTVKSKGTSLSTLAYVNNYGEKIEDEQFLSFEDVIKKQKSEVVRTKEIITSRNQSNFNYDFSLQTCQTKQDQKYQLMKDQFTQREIYFWLAATTYYKLNAVLFPGDFILCYEMLKKCQNINSYFLLQDTILLKIPQKYFKNNLIEEWETDFLLKYMFLESIKIFKFWSRRVYNLSLYFVQQRYIQSDIIYQEGDQSQYLYLIQDGEVEISIFHPSMKNDRIQRNVYGDLFRVQLAIIGPNNYFGENEIIRETLRNSTAKVVSSEILIYQIHRTQLLQIVCQQEKSFQKHLETNLQYKQIWEEEYCQQVGMFDELQPEPQSPIVDNNSNNNNNNNNNNSNNNRYNDITNDDVLEKKSVHSNSPIQTPNTQDELNFGRKFMNNTLLFAPPRSSGASERTRAVSAQRSNKKCQLIFPIKSFYENSDTFMLTNRIEEEEIIEKNKMKPGDRQNKRLPTEMGQYSLVTAKFNYNYNKKNQQIVMNYPNPDLYKEDIAHQLKILPTQNEQNWVPRGAYIDLDNLPPDLKEGIHANNILHYASGIKQNSDRVRIASNKPDSGSSIFDMIQQSTRLRRETPQRIIYHQYIPSQQSGPKQGVREKTPQSVNQRDRNQLVINSPFQAVANQVRQTTDSDDMNQYVQGFANSSFLCSAQQISPRIQVSTRKSKTPSVREQRVARKFDDFDAQRYSIPVSTTFQGEGEQIEPQSPRFFEEQQINSPYSSQADSNSNTIPLNMIKHLNLPFFINEGNTVPITINEQQWSNQNHSERKKFWSQNMNDSKGNLENIQPENLATFLPYGFNEEEGMQLQNLNELKQKINTNIHDKAAINCHIILQRLNMSSRGGQGVSSGLASPPNDGSTATPYNYSEQDSDMKNMLARGLTSKSNSPSQYTHPTPQYLKRNTVGQQITESFYKKETIEANKRKYEETLERPTLPQKQLYFLLGKSSHLFKKKSIGLSRDNFNQTSAYNDAPTLDKYNFLANEGNGDETEENVKINDHITSEALMSKKEQMLLNNLNRNQIHTPTQPSTSRMSSRGQRRKINSDSFEVTKQIIFLPPRSIQTADMPIRSFYYNNNYPNQYSNTIQIK